MGPYLEAHDGIYLIWPQTRHIPATSLYKIVSKSNPNSHAIMTSLIQFHCQICTPIWLLIIN